MIQNVDRNVKPAEFKDRPLLVTSIFPTLQGEGPYAGQAAVFVRFAGCNFGAKDVNGACAWCDTYFAVDGATVYGPQELYDKVNTMMKERGISLVVITGGEPFLQNPKMLSFFVRLLLTNPFCEVQFETNGTQVGAINALVESIEQEPMRRMASRLRIVISPKAIYKASRYSESPEKHLSLAAARLVQYKFVVEADPSSPHHTLPDWAFTTVRLVYVSPMAAYARPYQGEVSSIWEEGLIDKERTARNYAYAAQYVMEHPTLRLSLQQHLFVAIP